jgi:hypothetical protein
MPAGGPILEGTSRRDPARTRRAVVLIALGVVAAGVGIPYSHAKLPDEPRVMALIAVVAALVVTAGLNQLRRTVVITDTRLVVPGILRKKRAYPLAAITSVALTRVPHSGAAAAVVDEVGGGFLELVLSLFGRGTERHVLTLVMRTGQTVTVPGVSTTSANYEMSEAARTRGLVEAAVHRVAQHGAVPGAAAAGHGPASWIPPEPPTPPPGSGPPGPGWWIASDGNWYPPDQHPSVRSGSG